MPSQTNQLAEIPWVVGSESYLQVDDITADVDLDAQPVKITFDGATFFAAEWLGATATNNGDGTFTRSCRTTSVLTAADFPAGKVSFLVYVQITDSSETPLLPVGFISLITP